MRGFVMFNASILCSILNITSYSTIVYSTIVHSPYISFSFPYTRQSGVPHNALFQVWDKMNKIVTHINFLEKQFNVLI